MPHVGVTDEEKASPREIIINIALEADSSKAADTDDLSYAIDYSEISSRIVRFATSRKFNLLETIATGTINEIFIDSRIQWARVEVEKPDAVPESDSVSVCLEQSNKRLSK